MTRYQRDIKPILALFLAEKRLMLLAGLALCATTMLAGIALLGLSGWFITATAIAGASLTTALAFDVFAPSAGIRLLAIGRTAARYGERLVTHDATLAVLAGLRERLFRGWAEPGAAGDLAKRPARLLFRLTQDIDALDSLYLRVAAPVFSALAVGLAVAAAFALMHPLAALGAAGIMVLALMIPVLAARAARRPSRLRAHGLEAIRSRSIDLVAGQTELLMAGRLQAQRDAVMDADARLAAADERLNRIEMQAGFGFGLLSAILLAGTLVAMAALVEAGQIGAPVAALGLLVALAALEPFAGLRRGAAELGRTLLAARRIAPRLRPEAVQPALPLPGPGFAAELDRVSLCHDGATEAVLHDITLTIQPGECLAVIGESGAGKTTLLSLLAGEITTQSGRVAAQPSVLLTQRSELFHDSLRDNLRLADPAAADFALIDALQAAGLAKDVAALPQGLDTMLGEGGFGLSGGQSRRLTLARLILRDVPLWLLDEPTEGLDGATARDVLARLNTKAREHNRAVIIATHIRREAEFADRLAIIEQGRIAKIITRGEPGFDAALAALRPD